MKHFVLFVVLFSFTYLFANVQESSGNKLKNIRVIANAFYGEDIDKINYKDAKMAMDIWIKKMADKLGASSTLAFFTDFDAVKKAKKEGKVDTLILSAHSYLKYLPYCKAEFSQGWMKIEKDGKPFFRFVILGHKDFVKKDEYVVEYYQYSQTSKLVGEIYAWKHGLHTVFKPVAKSSKPVLDLFFHKADLAVVKEETWNIMQELNPQLTKELRVMHYSDRIFVDIITLFSNQLSQKDKDIYIKAIEAINTTPDGKQLMELFKFNGLTKMGEDQFKEMEKFYRKYQELKAQYEK
jgi:ABC-type phosphate/phosphonate transport system substrate-binding protein